MPGSGFAQAPRGTKRTIRRGWQWGAVAVATSLASVVGPATAVSASTRTHTGTPTGVVVRATAGHLDDAEGAVRAAGGTVERELGIINGFSADVPADAIATIAASSAVFTVTEDTAIEPMGLDSTLGVQTTVDTALSAAATATNPLGFDAGSDFGSLSSVTRLVGAQDLWQSGYTGKGVDVALIDTGVAPVSGIVDNVVDGPDLSFDLQAGVPAGVDAFGHGTHMAGIIAGRDSDASESSKGCKTCLNSSGYSDTTKFVGVAPDARVVNVKVGSFDGATDVSQVIAGIDWVVQHRNDNGLNIRVLNLSFGTDSAQAYRLDPLSYAAEVAWRRGIVVVAAAGNDGNDVRLTDPAYNPTILAVGASDPDNSRDPREGFVTDFTNGGTGRGVDVVAPGTHIASLRSPGSFIDELVPTSRLADRFTRGTRNVAGGRRHLGLRRRPDPAVPGGDTRPDQGARTPQRAGPAPQREVRRQRDHQRHGSAEGQAAEGEGRGPGFRAGERPGVARGGARHRARRDRRRCPERRAGRLRHGVGRPALVAGGMGRYELERRAVERPALVRRRLGRSAVVERELGRHRLGRPALVGSPLVGSPLVRGPLVGRDWSGRRWSGSDWSGRRWSGDDWSGARWSGIRWSGVRWSGDWS